jgi:hypothetical protein
MHKPVQKAATHRKPKLISTPMLYIHKSGQEMLGTRPEFIRYLALQNIKMSDAELSKLAHGTQRRAKGWCATCPLTDT